MKPIFWAYEYNSGVTTSAKMSHLTGWKVSQLYNNGVFERGAMISAEELMKIKVLHAQGYSQRKIARELNISRNTVRKYINSKDCEPTYQPRVKGVSKLDPFKS